MPYASVLMELQNQQPVATYTYCDDLISYHQGIGSQYYLYDALGSTRALANENGQLTDSYNYDAFGANTEHQGSSNNKYQYAGEQKDVTGNYYLRARYYNPSIGRFTQMDTFVGLNSMPITLNKYIYANAAPTMFVDPSGNISIAGVMAGINGQMNLQNARVAKAADQVKSIVSSLCKTSSQLAGFTQIHHSFPVFLGNTRRFGNKGDTFVDEYIHGELHKLLNLMFIINELPHPNRGKNKFRDIFENDRKDWKKALKVTKQTAKYVDKICEPIVTPKYSYDPIEPKISQAMKDWGVYKW